MHLFDGVFVEDFVLKMGTMERKEVLFPLWNIQFMKNHNYSCQSIPQLLRTISSRQLLNSQSRGKYQKNWPTSSSFTLLNKTQMYKSTRPSTCASQKDNQSTFVTEN